MTALRARNMSKYYNEFAACVTLRKFRPQRRMALRAFVLAVLVSRAAYAAPGCAGGCAGGTCFEPLGRCDCPAAFAGPSCATPSTPACLLGSLHTGCMTVSSCACLTECETRGWPSNEVGVCVNASSLDQLLHSPLLVYGSHRLVEAGMAGIQESPRADAWSAVPGGVAAPADCPAGCSDHGLCLRQGEGSEPRCSCFLGWQGHDCNLQRILADTGCAGGCSGERGECLEGWCRCRAGFYGADCALEGAERERLYWERPAADVAAVLRPRVYVYTLPPQFNAWFEHTTPERNLGLQLHERLLSSRYRTADPEEADFFYVPVAPMGLPSGLGQQSHYLAVEAARWVAETHPFWARRNGSDHLFAFGWDFGGCPVGGHPVLRNSIHISHFGLTERDRAYHCDCPLCSPSFTPGKDFVVPDTFELPYKQQGLRLDPSRRRNTLVFFAGYATGPDRKALFTANLTGAGVRIIHGRTANLAAEMADSTFCLSAPGAGFGSRAVIGIAFGCLPVAFADNVAEPWEGVVDWDAFGVRVARSELPGLVERLRGFTASELAAKRRALACVARHFWWSSIHGALDGEDGSGDAFETLMYGLRRRLAGADAAGAAAEAVHAWPLLGCGAGLRGAPERPLKKLCGWREVGCGARGGDGQLPVGGAACAGMADRPC